MSKQKKPARKYQYGAQSFPTVPAQKAGEELARIEAKHGGLKPSQVVDESRPEEAVLHPVFEWNDEIAAEKYRNVQAGQIIRSVRVVSESPDGQKEKTPAYVSVVRVVDEDKSHREYVSTSRAMGNEEWKRGVLAEALDQLRAFARRYKQLGELAGLSQEVESIIDRYAS